MSKKKNYLISSVSGLTAFFFVFSYSVCFSASLQLNIWYSLITSVVCLIVSLSERGAIFAPHAYLAVPVLLVLSLNTNALMPFCVITGALLYYIFNKKPDFFKLSPPILCAVTLGLAFSVTALLTTHYFGIGANGFTVSEILKNYRSLGFHPNWRGVFFGTITLFSMITYPFKFRRASKYFPEEAFSLLLPLLLNLWLNPDAQSSPVNELSSLLSLPAGTPSFFLPSLSTSFHLSFKAFANCFFSAFSIAFIMIIFKKQNERADSRTTANVITGITGGFPVQAYPITNYTILSSVVSITLIFLSFFCFGNLIARIPLHSAAVVLIMSAWKSIPYNKFSKAGKNGVPGIIALIVIFVSFIFTNVFFSLLLAIVINYLLSLKGGAEND